MKNLIILIGVLVGFLVFHAEIKAESSKDADLGSRLTRMEAELKQVKTELELVKVKLQLKDKQIELLKQKFAALQVNTASHSKVRYTSAVPKATNKSNKSNLITQETGRRNNSQVNNPQLLKYYESERKELETQIKSAERDLKFAKETIGKESRQYKVRQCKNKLTSLYSKRDYLDSKIKKLQFGVY